MQICLPVLELPLWSSYLQNMISYTSKTQNAFGFLCQTSTHPIYEKMWAFMRTAETPVFVDSNAVGIQRVRDSNGRYAFLIESVAKDYINERKPCDTMRVGDLLNWVDYGIGTPLGSDLRLVRLMETNLADEFHWEVFPHYWSISIAEPLVCLYLTKLHN